MARALGVDDFEQYFTDLWQLPPEPGPFPWQSALVRQLDQERVWPRLVDLPTGAGKTSLLDIAVFLLALDAARPAAERWMPRRVILVVDRRVVVDQADERGARIARALAGADGDGVLAAVAERLRTLSGGGPPLVTAVLRGGIVRDESWARRPDVPALISSTVDQVGSRLLFRGYGVSAGMRPIHAGLLGNDALLLLDEVHLARPFAETLDAVARFRSGERADDVVLPDRWQVVQLTATPTTPAERRFPTEPLDPASHPVLGRRLLARKPARLEIVKVAKDTLKANEQFAAHCVKLARGLLLEPHIRTVGVVVNRVDTARRVARQLDAVESGPQVLLLTGRMRPVDRDELLQRWRARLVTGRTRRADDEPLVVVATQSIEAGADFDLDGIVTECASLDALRQRFGRVDRDGRLNEAGTPSSSVVAIRSTDVAGEPDPVYGSALANTWAWLDALPAVDFGLTALQPPDGATGPRGSLVPAPSRAPRLLPGHLDRWVQTSQAPAPWDPDVAGWLHGIDQANRVADVQLVWRADLDGSLFARELPPDLLAEVVDRIQAAPPVSSEALAVTIGDFRRWARGLPIDPTTADLEGGEVPDLGRGDGPPRRFFRWFGGRAELVEAVEVRPGDTVIVPAAAGGLWAANWDPEWTAPVGDAALVAASRQRGRGVVRLSRPLWPSDVAMPDPDELENESASERRAAVQALLRELAEHDEVDDETRKVLRLVAADRSARVRPLIERVDGFREWRSYVVTSTRPIDNRRVDVFGDLAPEDGLDATSFTGARPVSLLEHLQGVAGWAERLATNVGLAEPLVADLRLAGRLHDLGKADSRFQRLLRAGGEVGDTDVLAKSATPDVDAVARRRAREQSGYPARARHELLSLAMISGDEAIEAGDLDLVRHLVGSHHGFGRYRFEPSIDDAPETVGYELDDRRFTAASDHGLHDLGAGPPDRFWRLVRRYGWFGLAWLEAVLRLADHCESRSEQEPAT